MLWFEKTNAVLISEQIVPRPQHRMRWLSHTGVPGRSSPHLSTFGCCRASAARARHCPV